MDETGCHGFPEILSEACEKTGPVGSCVMQNHFT
jgi:hypothetical protein